MSRMSVAVAFVDNQFQLKFITLYKFAFFCASLPPVTLFHVHFEDQKFLCA